MRLGERVRRTLTVVLAGALVGLAVIAVPGVAFAYQRLDLSVYSGEVGTTFTAWAGGFAECTEVEFTWVDPDVTAASAPVDQRTGEVEAGIQVPYDFDLGSHGLLAHCWAGDNERVSNTREFEVVDGPAELDVSPSEGDADASLTALATGFAECVQSEAYDDLAVPGTVVFTWRDLDLPSREATVRGGTATAYLTVPSSFTDGRYVLVATCESRPSLTAEDTFDLTGPGETHSPEDLALTPSSGAPSTSFTVDAHGYDCDYVELLWDGSRVGFEPADAGVVAAELSVPADAQDGDHRITARCATDADQSDQAVFSVTASPTPSPTSPDPQLRLSAYAGERGDSFTAAVRGYACAEISFSWDDTDPAKTSRLEAGEAVARLSVPEDLSLGDHDLVARCVADTTQTSQRTFRVIPPSDAAEVLRLSVHAGEPGARFTATAAGYDCGRGRVLFHWDDSVLEAVPVVGRIAVAELSVPKDAAPGRHKVAAVCATDDTERDSRRFTVTSVVPTSDLSSYWPGAAALLLLVAGGLPALRLQRQRRWVHDHLGVRAAAAAGSSMRTSESPQDPSARDVEVRIEPHPGPGTQSIKEVEE